MADLLKPLTETERPDTMDALRPDLPQPPSISENIEFAFGNEFTKGFRRGALGLAGTSIAAGGQIAETLGAKEKAASMFDEARRLTDFPQGLRPRVETWDDVKDTGSFVDYGLSKMGEAAPSSLLSIGAGAAGGVVGAGLRAAGLRALGPSTMGYAAGAGSMLPAEAGEAALTMQNDPQAMANTTPGERLAIAGGKGAVNAALEFLPERLAFGRAFTRPSVGKAGLASLARNTAAGGVEGALGEAATEATQEFTGQIAHGFANPQRDTSQDLIAMREAALGGAFGGAPMGASAGLVQGTRENLSGAMERGKGALKNAQASGKLPTVEDAATFLRRAAQEPEFFGEQAEGLAEQGVDAAKRGWKTIGEISAKAADKGEAIVAEANKTLFDAIGAYKDLDKPGEEVNREFLLGLQNNIANMTKDTYFALKEIIKDPTSATTRQQLGYYAKGLATEKLPAAKQRTMDWTSRLVAGWKRGVDKKVKTSLEWTDAKDASRKALATIKDDALKQFRGLSIAEQRALVGVMFAAKEAPQRITPEVSKAFEEITGLTIGEAQSYADAQQQTTARRTKQEYRAEMVKKIAGARKAMAGLLPELRDGSPELYRKVKADIAKKYGLSLTEIEEGVGTSRTEAAFNVDEIENEYDVARALEAETKAEEGRQEGTKDEIEPPTDLPITRDTLNKSVQNMHYFHRTKPDGQRPHITLQLRDVTEGVTPLSGAEILRLFDAPDGRSSKKAPRRAFTEDEILALAKGESASLPVRPFSLANQMATVVSEAKREGGQSFNDPTPPLREGERGSSPARKATLTLTALATLQNQGLKVVDSNGVERTLEVTPEEDFRDVVVGAMAAKDSNKEAQTFGSVQNQRYTTVNDTDEQLAEQRDVLLDLFEKRKSMNSFEFGEMLKARVSDARKRVDALQENTPEHDAAWKEWQAIKKYTSSRAGRAMGAISDAKEEAQDDGRELTPDELKAITNEAWEEATDSVLKERLERGARKTVANGFDAIEQDLQEQATDRLVANPEELIKLIDDVLTYLGSDGVEVPDSVKTLFRENNVRLFTPEVLKNPVMKNKNGKTPQDDFAARVEWLRRRAAENQFGLTYDRPSVNDFLQVDAETKEIAGIGNVLWDLDSRFWNSFPVTKAVKEKLLEGFVELKQMLSKHGKWRVRGDYNLGFFKTKKEAQEFIDSLPEDGANDFVVKIEGRSKLYTLEEARKKWGRKITDKDELHTVRMASIINPETGTPISLAGKTFEKMLPEEAVIHLRALTNALPSKARAKVIDGTPTYTEVEAAPVRKEFESDEDYKQRLKGVKQKKSVLTLKQLDSLIKTKENADPNLKVPMPPPTVNPQGDLDLMDDVLMEENKVQQREAAPLRPTDFQEITADKQGKLDLFEPTETPKPEVERHYQMRNKAGLSGETTMHPMYLWKRSLKRAKETVAKYSKAEPTPEAPEPKDTLKYGRVRTPFTAPVSFVRDPNAVAAAKKSFDDDLADPPNDEDLRAALAKVSPQTSKFAIEATSDSSYPRRTYRNARETDATVAFAVDFTTGGEVLTRKAAGGKKYIAFNLSTDKWEAARKLTQHLQKLGAKSLNIAGNGIYTLKATYPKRTSEELQRRLDWYVYDVLRLVHEQYPLREIRSGGQTGADEAGAKAGIALGIPTKVLMPKDYLTRTATQYARKMSELDAIARFFSPKGARSETAKAAATEVAKAIEVKPPQTPEEQRREIEQRTGVTELQRRKMLKQFDDAQEFMRKRDEAAQPAAAQPKAAKAKSTTGALDKFEAAARKKFFAVIKKAGGISLEEMRNITGETNVMRGNNLHKGLFSKNGKDITDVAHALMEAGYITEETKSDYDFVRDLIRTALDKTPIMTMADTAEHGELLRAVRDEAEEDAAPSTAVAVRKETSRMKPLMERMLTEVKRDIQEAVQQFRKLAKEVGGVENISPAATKAIQDKIDANSASLIEELQKELAASPPTEADAVAAAQFLQELERLMNMFGSLESAVLSGEVSVQDVLNGKLPAQKIEVDSDLTNDEKAERSMPEDTRLPEDQEPTLSDEAAWQDEEAKGENAKSFSQDRQEREAEQEERTPVVGENIASPFRGRNTSPLAAALTNVTYGKYPVDAVPGLKKPDPTGNHKMSAEAWYQANKTGNERKDKLIMQRVIEAKLRQYPELMKQVAERGGAAWIKASRHEVTGNPRWEGKGFESNFIRVLHDAYQAVEEFPSPEEGKEVWRRIDSGYTPDEAGGFVRREPAKPTENEYSGPAVLRKMESDPQLKKEAEAFADGARYVVMNVDAHGGKFRELTPEQIAARAGKTADLVHEPDLKFDINPDTKVSNAIKVVQNGVHHTYVSREYNQNMLKRGLNQYEAKFDSTGKYLIIKRSKPEKVYEDSDLSNEERAELSMPEDTRQMLEVDDELDRLNTPHAAPKTHFVPMNYRAAKGQLRPELNKKYPDGAPMTLLIKNGDRTATTRRPHPGAHKGDTVKFYGSPAEYVITGFERVDMNTPEGRERWSKREGWSPEGVREAGHGEQVKTGSVQMIWAKKDKQPIVKEQRTGKKEEFVGPPEEQAGPPLPPFVGPPTARDLGIMKKDQETQRQVPPAVPKKIADLVEKMFGKKVKIIIGAPNGKGDTDATAWYVGRKQLDTYKKNMADIEATRAARRKALREKDFGLANDLRKKEEELLKQTQAVGLIYLSPKLSEAEQLGAFYHEAVHAAFDILLNPEQRAILASAFSQGLVRNKLRQIFKDDPTVLEHMEDAEEAAAYAFQVWAVTPEKLPLGGKVQGVFNRIKQFLRKLMGILTAEEKANILFNDMITGRMSNEGLSSLQKQLDKDMTLKERTIKTARDMAQIVHSGWNTFVTSSYDRLMKTGNPALQQLAQSGYVKTGEDRKNGMVQQWFQQRALWLNKLDKSMKGFSEEALKEAMEARLHERQAKGTEARQAYDAMEKYFNEMHKYFQEVDPDNQDLIGWEKHYFPNMWDPEKVMKDRDGFLAMVNKPEYATYLEELKVTPTELWEHISGYLIRGESFQSVVNERTNEPINEYSKKRSLSFMTPEDRRPFLQDDPIHVMLHYTNQMVRHAEFMRAYGVGGGKLQQLLDEAKNKYGATKNQMEWAQDYVDGLLGNKEVGMSRELKDVYGAMVVYQNFRLLPFSLFSSLVDPLGIAVRSNNLTDALETFGYSLKNIFRDLKKRDDIGKDYWERLAEDWGIIEDAQVLANIHNMYESIELRGFSKRLNEGLFKYNLLNGWVRSTKIMAVKASHRFILRAGKDQLGKDSERYLEELGLKKSDVVPTTNGGLAVTKDELVAQGVSEKQAVEIEKRLQAATTKFVNQAVLNPTSADLPNWGSNPYFAPIFHLKQFMFTFQNVILARIAHEMSQGNYKPLWVSTIFIPGMIAADALRGFVSNMGEEPPWQKDWTVGDYLVNGVERSGLLGTGALLTGMKDDMMHGGQGYESLAGPTVEQLKKGAKVALGQGDAGNFVVKSMPLNPIYDQWLLSSGGKEQ